MKPAEPRIREIPIEEIDRSRNHRIPRPGDAERLESIKQSIEACGQLQPIRVYKRGKDQEDKKHKQPYILGFGNRRCRAVEMLGHKTILAIVFEPASETQIAQARAVENVHRQDITPLEEVQAVSDVLEAIKADPTFTGDLHDEAAARLGCEPTWVRDRDYLHRLTKAVQHFALRSGLPAGHLRELAKVGDPADQMRLACEAAGAPPHAFPAEIGNGKIADWQRQLQENYFAQYMDGKVERWPLSRLREQVARVQLSLRLIPWEFDQPVNFGATKLRKCAGCPHNSETDRTLFGIDEDAANPLGYCLNASCYNAKVAAADAAKEHVLKKITGRNDQTPEAIRTVTPEWLKSPTVVGYVKRQLEKAATQKPEPPQPKSAIPTGRTLTEHEAALQKFTEAFNAWELKAYKAIMKAINADPVNRVNWCVLLGVSTFWEQPGMQIPRVHMYSTEPCTEEPVAPPLPEEIERAIQAAFKGTRNGWLDLLKDYEQANPSQRAMLAFHPRALELLAEAMQVKLSVMPQWKAVAAAPAAATAATKQEAAA